MGGGQRARGEGATAEMCSSTSLNAVPPTSLALAMLDFSHFHSVGCDALTPRHTASLGSLSWHAAHLLLDDVQLQLDTELSAAGCPLLSSPIFLAPVLHFAHDALVFCRHSSGPWPGGSSSAWKAQPSASPGQVPLSFEVLPHVAAAPPGCLCCLCPQVLTFCAFTFCSVHSLPAARAWNTQ